MGYHAQPGGRPGRQCIGVGPSDMGTYSAHPRAAERRTDNSGAACRCALPADLFPVGVDCYVLFSTDIWLVTYGRSEKSTLSPASLLLSFCHLPCRMLGFLPYGMHTGRGLARWQNNG